MSRDLTELLRNAADDRTAHLVLPPAADVLRHGRSRRRRRTVLPVLLAVSVAAAGAMTVQSLRDEDGDAVVAGPSQTGAASAPDGGRLREVLTAVEPDRTIGEVATIPAGDTASGALGPWSAPGRSLSTDALIMTTTDKELSVDWATVTPPLQATELDAVARRAVPSAALTAVATGSAQDGEVRSRVYTTPDGFITAYGWTPTGGVTAVRGGGGPQPEMMLAKRLETIARELLRR